MYFFAYFQYCCLVRYALYFSGILSLISTIENGLFESKHLLYLQKDRTLTHMWASFLPRTKRRSSVPFIWPRRFFPEIYAFIWQKHFYPGTGACRGVVYLTLPPQSVRKFLRACEKIRLRKILCTTLPRHMSEPDK